MFLLLLKTLHIVPSRLLSIHLPIHLSVHSFIHPLAHPSIHSFINPPTHWSFHSSIHLPYLSINFHPTTHLPTHLSTHPFIYPFIHLFIHPSIPLLNHPPTSPPLPYDWVDGSELLWVCHVASTHLISSSPWGEQSPNLPCGSQEVVLVTQRHTDSDYHSERCIINYLAVMFWALARLQNTLSLFPPMKLWIIEALTEARKAELHAV